MSVQMTVVAPSASMAGRCRTRTLRFATRWAASTRARVRVGRSPSGTIAMMMPTAKMKSSQIGIPIAQPIVKKSPPMKTASRTMSRLRWAICRRRGNSASPPVWVRCAMPPNSVCMPVANTTALPWPATTHRGAGEQQVAAVGWNLLCAGLRVPRLGERLPSQGGIVDAHRHGLDEAAVRWHVVPFLQQENITGNQPLGGDLQPLGVPQDLDLLGQQALERGERPLGSVLLPEGEQAADQDHHDHRVAQPRHALVQADPLQDEREQGRDPEYQGERRGELRQQT